MVHGSARLRDAIVSSVYGAERRGEERLGFFFRMADDDEIEEDDPLDASLLVASAKVRDLVQTLSALQQKTRLTSERLKRWRAYEETLQAAKRLRPAMTSDDEADIPTQRVTVVRSR